MTCEYELITSTLNRMHCGVQAHALRDCATQLPRCGARCVSTWCARSFYYKPETYFPRVKRTLCVRSNTTSCHPLTALLCMCLRSMSHRIGVYHVDFISCKLAKTMRTVAVTTTQEIAVAENICFSVWWLPFVDVTMLIDRTQFEKHTEKTHM